MFRDVDGIDVRIGLRADYEDIFFGVITPQVTCNNNVKQCFAKKKLFLSAFKVDAICMPDG